MSRGPPTATGRALFPLLSPLLLLLSLSTPAWAQVNIAVNTQGGSAPVVPSFMGLSMEPLIRAKEWVAAPEFVQMIQNLASYSTGPFIIRWGGNSEDTLLEVIDDETWKMLADLHNKTGVQYILGLNLLSRNVTLAVAQVTAALNILPPKSIYELEVGNEPDRFSTLYPETAAGFPPSYVTKAWYDDQKMYMDALAKVVLQKLGTVKIFSGPNIADISNWRTEYIKNWFYGDKTGKYAKGVASHWYATQRTWSNANMDTILSETMMRVTATNGARWAALAKTAGLTFRFSETNSIALGGLAGVSDTLGAALFVVDYAMNLIQAGVHGMNLHMGACSPYSAITLPIPCDNEGCSQICVPPAVPLVSAPYFGMWMVQKAIAGRPNQFLDVTTSSTAFGNIQSYAFEDNVTGEVRVVLIKKSGLTSAPMNVVVKGSYQTGLLTVLQSSNGVLQDKVQLMSLGGQTIDASGNIAGNFSPQQVTATPTTAAGTQATSYSFSMPAASAVLLVMARPGSVSRSPPPPVPVNKAPPKASASTSSTKASPSPSTPPVNTPPSPPPELSQPRMLASNDEPLPCYLPLPDPPSPPLPSPPPSLPPPQVPDYPTNPNYQITVRTQGNAANGVTTDSITSVQCPLFLGAVRLVLQNVLGLDPLQAYPGSDTVNGCSVVSGPSSGQVGKVFYKAYLHLPLWIVDPSLSIDGPDGMPWDLALQAIATDTFVWQAKVWCGSVIQYGLADQQASIQLDRSSLSALMDPQICTGM